MSKDDLYYYVEILVNGEIYSTGGRIDNKVQSIRVHFFELDDIQQKHNFENIHIICEPTGGYERKLLKMAETKNYLKSYISRTKYIRVKDLDEIYKNASISKKLLSYELSCLYEAFFIELYKHIEEYETAKEELKVKMADVYMTLP